MPACFIYLNLLICSYKVTITGLKCFMVRFAICFFLFYTPSYNMLVAFSAIINFNVDITENGTIYNQSLRKHSKTWKLKIENATKHTSALLYVSIKQSNHKNIDPSVLLPSVDLTVLVWNWHASPQSRMVSFQSCDKTDNMYQKCCHMT